MEVSSQTLLQPGRRLSPLRLEAHSQNVTDIKDILVLIYSFGCFFGGVGFFVLIKDSLNLQ